MLIGQVGDEIIGGPSGFFLLSFVLSGITELVEPDYWSGWWQLVHQNAESESYLEHQS